MTNSIKMLQPPGVAPLADEALLDCMELLRAARMSTLTDILCFLHVGENPGLNVGDLSRRIDLTAGTVSRAIRAMAPKGMRGARQPFLGLIEMRRSSRDLRDRHLFLTEEGQALRRRLEAAAASRLAARRFTAARPRTAANG